MSLFKKPEFWFGVSVGFTMVGLITAAPVLYSTGIGISLFGTLYYMIKITISMSK